MTGTEHNLFYVAVPFDVRSTDSFPRLVLFRRNVECDCFRLSLFIFILIFSPPFVLWSMYFFFEFISLSVSFPLFRKYFGPSNLTSLLCFTNLVHKQINELKFLSASLNNNFLIFLLLQCQSNKLAGESVSIHFSFNVFFVDEIKPVQF